MNSVLLYRISNARICNKTYFNYGRHISYKADDYNRGLVLPLTMTCSSLRSRMQKDNYLRGFNSSVTLPDDELNISKPLSKPIGKIMEDKQSQMSTQNNLVSLDPNASMWQHSFQTERESPPEDKDNFFSKVQTFYSKRCEDEGEMDYDLVGPIDSKTSSIAAGMSLYSIISKKGQMRQRIRRGMDNYLMDYPTQESDDPIVNQAFPQESKKKRSIPPENIQDNPAPPMYKTFGSSNRPQMNEPSNVLKMAAARNSQYEKQMQAHKQSGTRRVPDRRGQTKNMRLADDESEDESPIQEVGYSTYESTNRKCPVVSSPRRLDDSKQSKTNHWPYKHSEKIDESKTDKYPAKVSYSHADSDDNDYMDVYSTASPPKPLFKPSSGIVTNKMKYFLQSGRDFAQNMYL